MVVTSGKVFPNTNLMKKICNFIKEEYGLDEVEQDSMFQCILYFKVVGSWDETGKYMRDTCNLDEDKLTDVYGGKE